MLHCRLAPMLVAVGVVRLDHDGLLVSWDAPWAEQTAKIAPCPESGSPSSHRRSPPCTALRAGGGRSGPWLLDVGRSLAGSWSCYHLCAASSRKILYAGSLRQAASRSISSSSRSSPASSVSDSECGPQFAAISASDQGGLPHHHLLSNSDCYAKAVSSRLASLRSPRLHTWSYDGGIGTHGVRRRLAVRSRHSCTTFGQAGVGSAVPTLGSALMLRRWQYVAYGDRHTACRE